MQQEHMKEREPRVVPNAISIDTEINPDTRRNFERGLEMIAQTQPDSDIPIMITSHGGSLEQLEMMLSTMERLKTQFGVTYTTIARGVAYSGGAILLALGDHRMAFPNTDIMLHETQITTPEIPEPLSQRRNEDLLFRRQFGRIERRLCKRMGKTLPELRKLYNKFLDENGALREGIIDEVIVFNRVVPPKEKGWGIERDYPSGTEVEETGDELLTDMLMGSNPQKPNEKGELPTRARKKKL